MNIGARIVQRLEELKWERKELLSRVPDLTPQALSNLITRDSVRSEWDEEIADALGVSVLWLVYNKEESRKDIHLSQVETELISGFRNSDETSRDTMLFLARRALIKDKRAIETGDFAPRPSVAINPEIAALKDK